MQDGIERHEPTGNHLAGVDDEDPRCGGDRESLCAITVQDEPGHAVEEPPVPPTARCDSVPDGRAGTRRVVPIAGQWGELSERRQKRRRICRATHFLQDEYEFNQVVGIGQLSPTLIAVPPPEVVGGRASLRDLANQGRRALLGYRLPDRLAPKALVVVELKKHACSVSLEGLQRE